MNRDALAPGWHHSPEPVSGKAPSSVRADSLRGHPLGQGVADFLADEPDAKDDGDGIYKFPSYDGDKRKSGMASFDGGNLKMITIVLKTDVTEYGTVSFQDVVRRLADRFGPASSTGTTLVGDGYGGKKQDFVVTWDQHDFFAQVLGDDDNCVVMLETPAARAAEVRSEHEAQPKF